MAHTSKTVELSEFVTATIEVNNGPEVCVELIDQTALIGRAGNVLLEDYELRALIRAVGDALAEVDADA